jgi:hypothetical protein
VTIVTYDGFNTNSGTQVDFVATGDITAGPVARIFVPDLSQSAAYHATVVAAAARGSFALQSLDGYGAALVR